ncbi:MAG: hypothetical protein ACRDOJ_02040 [Nocardioidaceae bacterium]
MPEEAELMGLDRNTEEGAMVALAGSLNGRRPGHRVIAWLILVSLAAPVVLSVLSIVF